jgi:hypothetical protein
MAAPTTLGPREPILNTNYIAKLLQGIYDVSLGDEMLAKPIRRFASLASEQHPSQARSGLSDNARMYP